MFERACAQIRNSIYGVMGTSQIAVNQVNCSTGTGFMISSGILVTAAHLVHVEMNFNKPNHSVFEVIRAPDIGQRLESAVLIAEDPIRDVALLRVDNPRSNDCVSFVPAKVPIGTSCGSLGFPLGFVVFSQTGKMFSLLERFQGANISSYMNQPDPSGRNLAFYETDSLMYRGSSGCPGFLEDSRVFGMHNKSVIDKPRDKGRENSKAERGVETRLAISLWVPSIDIIQFAQENGITL